MKFKIIILLILSTIITYLIYKTNPDKEYYILSIYDKTTSSNYPYNNILKEKLNKFKIIYDETISENNLEIENVIDNIINNKNHIKQNINKADLLIINLGFYETNMSILYNSNISKELLEDVTNLYRQIRKISSSPILFIGPMNISTVLNNALKNIANSYNVDYIKNNYYTPQELADLLLTKIDKFLNISANEEKTVANYYYYDI